MLGIDFPKGKTQGLAHIRLHSTFSHLFPDIQTIPQPQTCCCDVWVDPVFVYLIFWSSSPEDSACLELTSFPEHCNLQIEKKYFLQINQEHSILPPYDSHPKVYEQFRNRHNGWEVKQNQMVFQSWLSKYHVICVT